jgi:hypothetical protein
MKAKIFGLTISSAIVVALFGGIHLSANAQQDAPLNAQDNSEPSDVLPPDIASNALLVDIINLSQAAVSEDVIGNYINNSQTRFNLTASQIIYLKDIGVPDTVVTAMIQHDQQLGEAPPPQPVQAAPAPPTTIVADDGFYAPLAPYGTWIYVEGYGRCWRPAVVVYDSGWQPYCDHGRWVYTNDGWYWVSDYSWGWATFHYGRWFHDAHYGWCWWPDTIWAPSWVCWRYSDDYCGWAPLPPHCVYREGVGLVYNGTRVSVGFDFGLSIGAFTFVSTTHFCDPHPARYRVGRTEVTQIYNNTTIINNITVNNNGNDNRTTIINHGIPRDHIAAVTHTEIPEVTVRDSDTPIRHGERFEQNGRTLVVNRPHIERTTSQNENHDTPRTIPSPTTGAPMQVPPPDQKRNNLPGGRNQTLQDRTTSPNGAPARPAVGNGNENRNSAAPGVTPKPPQNQPSTQPDRNERQNQNNNPPDRNGAARFGNTLPQAQTPTQTRTQPQPRSYPSVQTPAPSRTPTYTSPANNQSAQPDFNQNNSLQQGQRTMSPRMSEQQPAPRAIVPPTQRPEPQNNYNAPYVAPPAPRVENPQLQPRTSQPPQAQQSQPSNPQEQRRDRDKNDR